MTVKECKISPFEMLYNWFVRCVWGIPSDAVPGNILHISQIGPIWFLEALFWANIELCLLMKVKSHVIRLFICVVNIFAPLAISRFFWLPFNMLNGIATGFYLYIGVCARKIYFNLSQRKTVIGAVIISVVCIGVYYYKHDNLSLSTINYPLYGLDIFGALSGCYIVTYMSVCIEKYTKYISYVLKKIGCSTLYILCVHTVDLELNVWKMLNEIILLGVAGKALFLLVRICATIFIGILVRKLLDWGGRKNWKY